VTQTELHTAYASWYDELLIFAINRVKNEQDAQEIVQDAFIKLWSCERDVDGQRAFLWTAVKNAAIDVIRHRKYMRQTEKALIEDQECPDDEIDFRQLQIEAIILADLLQAVQLLPNTCRKVFVLYWKGRRTEQIMALLGISRQNVLNQKTRAINLLRCKLLNKHV